MDNITEEIIAFFKKKDPEAEIDAETELSEIADSLFSLETVVWLSRKYRIKIARRDITPENLKNAESIARLVRRYQESK